MIGAVRGGAIKLRFRTLNSNSCARLVVFHVRGLWYAAALQLSIERRVTGDAAARAITLEQRQFEPLLTQVGLTRQSRRSAVRQFSR